MENVGSLTMKFPGKRAVIAAAWPAETAEWSELLEKLGFSERFCADDGAEALRLVRAELPDLLLADEILPVLDGVTLSERILRAPLAVQPGVLLVRPAGMLLRPTPPDCVSLYRPLTAEKIAAAAEKCARKGGALRRKSVRWPRGRSWKSAFPSITAGITCSGPPKWSGRTRGCCAR